MNANTARLFILAQALAASSMLQVGCTSSGCPSIPTCAFASHSGLRVTVDLAQVESEIVDGSFELRIQTPDQEPRLYACSLGQACELSSPSSEPFSAEYDEAEIREFVDISFSDARTLVVDLVLHQGERRVFGPEQSTFQIRSGALVQSAEFTPKYTIFEETKCADCRIASESWTPQAAYDH